MLPGDPAVGPERDQKGYHNAPEDLLPLHRSLDNQTRICRALRGSIRTGRPAKNEPCSFLRTEDQAVVRGWPRMGDRPWTAMDESVSAFVTVARIAVPVGILIRGPELGRLPRFGECRDSTAGRSPLPDAR